VSKISGYASDIYTEKININLPLNYTISLFQTSYFMTQVLLNGWIGQFIHSFKHNNATHTNTRSQSTLL